MPELWFDHEAERALRSLERDRARGALARRLDDVLDLLERDPGSVELRRHRFVTGLWGVVVGSDDENWIVLWEPHPTIADAIVVQYVGPASFA
ncbi:MAG: hypothetical protein ACKOIA_05300 [Acidimicrobiia bacterium]